METKNPLESKGIQGALVVLLTYVIFNHTNLEITQLEISNLMESVFVIGGALWSAYGRWVAENPISIFKSDTIKVDVSKLSQDERSAIKSMLSGVDK